MEKRFNVTLHLDEEYECMALEIRVDGELVESHHDGGEPEDNSFGRDWSWVPDAIRNAYSVGVEHGKEF